MSEIPELDYSELWIELNKAWAKIKRLQADKESWKAVSDGAIKEQFRLAGEVKQMQAVLRDLVERWATERGYDDAIQRARALVMQNDLTSPTEGDLHRALEQTKK